MEGRGHVPQGVWEGVIVRADEIADYCTPEFYEALYLWDRTKKWGWANGNKGWAHEPYNYMTAVMAIDDAARAAEADRMAQAEAARARPSSPMSKGKKR